MQGTPESENLYQLLRLRRPDIEFLGLDDFETLIGTDLLRDSEVADIFRQCGCADLVRFIIEDVQGQVQSGQARRFKSFLGRTTMVRLGSDHEGMPSLQILPSRRSSSTVQ
jgi:hypothetical protein